jgi:GTP-binding protein Era
MSKADKQIKFGRVIILGRPNTGKSTLLNNLLGQKVAISSPLPQTTRKNQEVVYESREGKIIFMDTPGITDITGTLLRQSQRAEVVLALVDISRPKNEEDNKTVGLVRKLANKKILVYNKTDIAIGPKDHLPDYNYLEEEFDQVIAISALKSKRLKELLRIIFDYLPLRSPGDIENEIELVARIDSKEHIAEIIREKAFLYLREELPYSIGIEVLKVEDKSRVILIEALVLTNKAKYKKMIIGAGGKKIREIGYHARKELELISGRQVYLALEVRVDKHWPERIS